MTFSSKVKNELCRVAVREDHSAAAELYGIFLFGNTFGTEGIRIVTENEAVSQRAKSLLKRVFNMSLFALKREERSLRMFWRLPTTKNSDHNGALWLRHLPDVYIASECRFSRRG